MSETRPLSLCGPRPSWILIALVLHLALIGCGGGGGGGQNPPPPPPPPSQDFALKVDPTTVWIPPGGTAYAMLSATAVNGFASPITAQVTGLPSGISVTPASISLTPGTPLQVTLSAVNSVTVGTTTVTFTGTSASLSHAATLNLTMTPRNTKTLSTRTRYVRTDAVTEYPFWINQHWVVYNAPTSRFFVTDPQGSHVFVLDAASETQVGSIVVPGAFGMDESPDQSTLYVGTLIGDVYSIDPVALKITRRYLASEIGPYGYEAWSALVLSDGRLALLGAQGGIPSVDGSMSIAVWNPTDNSITIYGDPNQPGVPASPLCGTSLGLHIFGFALTSDRTSILTNVGGLCKLNASTGQYMSATPDASAAKISASADGRYVAFPSYPGSVVLYDAHTLGKITEFSVAGDTSSAAGLVFSADSKTLFVPSDNIVYAYGLANYQQVGWFPNIFLPPTSGGYAVGPVNSPDYQAVDGTGLLAGPVEEGFGFVDSSAMHTGPDGTAFTNAYLNPATGPATGGTQIELSAPPTVDAQSDIFFGTHDATAISKSGFIAAVTPPPGTPGPVDVYVFAHDGGMQLIPDGFSYGPTILQVTPDVSTAEGGGIGVIYGYAFGPTNTTVIPTDLSVTVGSKLATIVGYNPNAYGASSPPFLLQSVYYTIPAGLPGPVDVMVTTSSGSVTASGALTYLPAARTFALPGAVLAQGIYDAYRDLYYFTDANKIRVFSLTQGQWLSPISIPLPAPGAVQRLWGISLSPDGSKLAMADAQAGAVYLVDPANTSSVRTFAIAPSVPQGFIVNPAGVAISDAGIVYLTVYVQGGTGLGSYFKLDTNTGILTAYNITGPGLGTSDLYLRTALSADNTRAYFNNLGYVFSIDTATDEVFPATTDQGCCYGDYDLTLSKNQTRFEASSYLFDSDLNAQSFYTLNDREILDISYVYGAKLSSDGSLLFQPAANSIDVFDGRLGILRDRVALPFALSTNYDALVHNGSDNVLLAITGVNGDGIAVVDLTSLGEPAPLPYAAARSSLSSAVGSRRSVRSEALSISRRSNNSTNSPAVRPHTPAHITKPNPLLPQ